MKKLLILFFLSKLFLFAQESYLDQDINVNGILTTNEGVYLVLEEGFTQISKIDPYLEYYRQIYNDTTIVNPNTEIKSDFTLNIIPFIAPTTKQRRIDFNEPLKLGIFVQMNNSNQFKLTPYAQEMVDSLSNP